MRALLSNRDYDQISAYLDGQLSASEKRKLEESMQTRPELKTVLEDLKQTRSLLRLAPRKRAPRNFALTPAMVRDIKKKQGFTGINSLFPAFSFASALATIALIFIVLFEFIPGSPIYQLAERQSEEVAMQAPAAEMTTDQSSADRTAVNPQVESEVQPTFAAAAPEAGILESPPSAIESKAAVGAGGGTGNIIVPDYNASNGEYAKIPGATGMGGGGSDSAYLDYGSGGPIVIPLIGINSIAEQRPSAVTQGGLPEGNSGTGFDRGGPILGISTTENAGKVIIRSAWGLPIDTAPDQDVQTTLNQGEQTIFGFPILRVVEFLLLIMAVVFGAGAVATRRKD